MFHKYTDFHKGDAQWSKALCSVDILCYFSPELLPGKDRKLMIYSKARYIRPAGTVAGQRYIDQDMF
jgi:hypothetical protein